MCRVYGETVTIAKYLQRFSGPGVVVASAETVRYALTRMGKTAMIHYIFLLARSISCSVSLSDDMILFLECLPAQ